MLIEDEIRQVSFKNEYFKGLINLIFTQSHILKKQKQFFDRYNLSYQQYNILRILRGQHPNVVSYNLIKERIVDKMSDVSRLLERLRLKELIIKNVSLTDKRLVDIKISKKGLALLKAIDPEIYQLEDLLRKLDGDEIVALNKILDKIRS